MKSFRIPIAIALILVPILARAVWFYQGIFWRIATIPTPDFSSNTIPIPPISTPAASNLPANPASTAVILLDLLHYNNFSPLELESLTNILNSRGARVEAVTSGSSYSRRSLADQLKYAASYITVSPLESYSLEEVQLLRGFVRRGGRLLVLTDPTRSAYGLGSGSGSYFPDVYSANLLLNPFDITFVDDYLYNMIEYEGNFRNVFFLEFADNELTKGLNSIVLYASHSVQTKTGTILMTSSEKTLSSLTDTGGSMSSAALDASGKVLAIGDMTFLQPPYNQVADNAILIQRLANFLIGAERVHDLADFPYLFQQPVTIVPLKDISLNANLLNPLNTLQLDLNSVDIQSTIASSAMDGKDLILLGTYKSPGIEDYLRPLDITLESSSPIKIPGFGSIEQQGTGLILFLRDKNRSTLVLLAEDSDSLTSLLSTIGPDGLSDCILQGDIAICRIGSFYGNSWDNSGNDNGGFEPTYGPTDFGPG